MSTTSSPTPGTPWLAALGKRIYPARGAFGVPCMLLVLLTVEPQPARGPLLEGLRGGLGWSLLALGLFLRIWGVGCWFRRDADGVIGGHRLMTTEGPYVYLRNPRYLGNLSLGAGVAALVGHSWLLVGQVLLWSAVHVPILAAEAASLGVRHGELYRAYCAQVPALFPRLSGVPPLRDQLRGIAWAAGLHEEMGTVMGWVLLGLFVEAWRAAALDGGWGVPSVAWLYLALMPAAALLCEQARRALRAEARSNAERPLAP